MLVTTWVVFGGLAGWITSLIAEEQDDHKVVKYIFVGIIGAVLIGVIMRNFGSHTIGSMRFMSLPIVIIGTFALVRVFATTG